MARLGALLTAVVTPFSENGAINDEAFVELLAMLADTGSDGVVVAGTTGEAPALTDDELTHLVELAVAERPTSGFTVVAGAGSSSTHHAVALTERVTSAGADGILSVTPYYVRPPAQGVIAHYTAVGQATDKPVLLYNIPGRAGIDLPNELLATIASFVPNVIGVKQSNNDSLAPVEGLDLYAGNDDVLARTLDIGGVGGICVSSHLVGAQMRRMIDEPELRHTINEALQDVFRTLFITSNPIPIKAALNLIGHAVGGPRLPLVAASGDEVAQVYAMLERNGLLPRKSVPQ